MTSGISVFSGFDSGNARWEPNFHHGGLVLFYEPDAGGKFSGWMFARIHCVGGKLIRITIANAGECPFASGFETLRMCISYDGREWLRVETEYDGREQRIALVPEHDSFLLATTPPYDYGRHLSFVRRLQGDERIRHDIIATSLDGRPVDRIRIGSAEQRPQVWIVGRQHPGEPMANWFIEGFVNRLLDCSDPVSCLVLENAVMNIVPMINPDGVFRGYHRTNAAGVDLNRIWDSPSSAQSPEVLGVIRAMDATGVDALLDIHGDEVVSHTYAYGLHNPPSGDVVGPARLRRFIACLEDATPDFHAEDTCAGGLPERPVMSMCTQQVVSRFGCLGVTIEMPFNDLSRRPNRWHGWGIDESRRFGSACVQALYGYFVDREQFPTP